MFGGGGGVNMQKAQVYIRKHYKKINDTELGGWGYKYMW